jgi:hypothetical protein
MRWWMMRGRKGEGGRLEGVRTIGHQRRSNVPEVIKFIVDTISMSERRLSNE